MARSQGRGKGRMTGPHARPTRDTWSTDMTTSGFKKLAVRAEAKALGENEIAALVAHGRELHARAFNQALHNLVARLRQLIG